MSIKHSQSGTANWSCVFRNARLASAVTCDRQQNHQCCHFSLFKTKSGLFCNHLVYFFAIWFIVYFFMFWFVFKDVLRQASTVFPAMMYVWFRRFKKI